MIRQARDEDLIDIKRIAESNKDALGFVMLPTLRTALAHEWLLVACEQAQVIGFCNYRHCRNGRTTIYELCVSEPYRGHGIGRQLVQTVIDEAREWEQSYLWLKSVVGLSAHTFYERLGFERVRTEEGRKRPLECWRYDVRPDLLRGW